MPSLQGPNRAGRPITHKRIGARTLLAKLLARRPGMRPLRRALPWVLAACLCAAVLAPLSSHAESPSSIETVVPITPGVLPIQPPVAALDPAGRPLLLWAEPAPEENTAQLMLATPPEEPRAVAQGLPLVEQTRQKLPGLAPLHPGYALSGTGAGWMAWAVAEENTALVLTRSLEGQEGHTWRVPADAALWSFGLDAEGGLVGAWWSPGSLRVYVASEGITLTLAIDPARTLERLQLALGAPGEGFVAWSAREGEAQQSSLWYAPLATQAAAVPVASGLLADLAQGADGTLHMAWLASEGLYYGNNLSRESRQLVAARLPASAPVALAAGVDHTAHLAWLDGGQLWYATSGDWALSRALLAEATIVPGLDLTVDAWNTPRLAWIQEGLEGQAANLYLLRPYVPAPSLQVTWPLEGQVLTGDTVARATSNRPAADWQRIEFYLQEEAPADGQFGLLRELAVDHDGTDGWEVALPTEGLDPNRRYRVVALGTGWEHGTLRAESGWFHASSAEELWLWPQPSAAEASGLIALAISPPAQATQLSRLDLYLSTEHTQLLRANGVAAPAEYFFSLEVEGGRERPMAYLDTRALPDGTYYVTARGYTRDEQMIPGRASAPLVINNNPAPLVSRVEANLLDATTGELELLARADKAHRQPDQVRFYLQRAVPSGLHGLEPAAADLLWVGSGGYAEGTWRALVRPQTSWYDQHWVIWSVACDADERCTSSSSGEPRVLWPGSKAALHLAEPTSQAPLQGVETIRLIAEAQAGEVLSATAWLEQPSGGLLPLGDLTHEGQEWSLPWDTTVYPNNAYRVLVWATLAEGGLAPIWSAPLTIRNERPQWSLRFPGPSQRLSGPALVALTPLEGAEPLARVTLYSRDAQGALSLLGEAQQRQTEWQLLWNTYATLDGAYTLVVELTSKAGEVTYVEQPVEVQNARPSITLLQGPGPEPVQGIERTVWYAQHPAGRPLTVSVEYSPDAGGHWLALAPSLPAGVSLSWDSTTVPDSDAAYLRLTVSDGTYAQQMTHGPFVVANENDPPAITLLEPRPGQVLGRSATVTWQAADADGQDLEVALYLRQNDGFWQLLADGLPATGSYALGTSALAPGEGYTLRALARDPEGAIGADWAEQLILVNNAPPEVELIWPNEDVHLSTEAVILWRAYDPDGDPLSVDLFYSDNGGLIWYPLAEGIQDSGYYVWQVSFLPPGGAYRLKVVAQDAYGFNQDEAEGLITLGEEQLPRVELLSPASGDTLSGVWPIHWWMAGTPPEGTEIDLLARIAGGQEWQPVVEGLALDDIYLWDTRDFAEGTYELVARARSGNQRSLSNVAEALQVRHSNQQPWEVELLSPTGGEFWEGLCEIRWRAHSAEGHALEAAIEMSTDAGHTWQTLATVDAAQGRYLWQTNTWPAGRHYRARVTLSDGETSSAASSAGAFCLIGGGSAPPHLIITSPDPSGTLAAGGLITWIAEDADGDPLLIDIEFSADGGQSWQPVAERLLNTGEYPLEQPLATDGVYQLGLVASDGTYRSIALSEPFTGAPAERPRPSIRLEAPVGGASLMGIVPIRWIATDPAGLDLRIEIAYSSDGGQTWQPIATGLENSGEHLWNTLPLANGTYLLRVTADNGRLRESATSAPLGIANPRRNAPQLSWAEKSLQGLQTGAYELRWRAWDADGEALTLELAYSLGPYGPWLPLAHDIANTGSYVWDPSSVPNTDDLWLRLTATDGRLAAITVEGPLATYHPASPRVQLLAPLGGEVWAGQQPIRWRVLHSGGAVEVSLQRSLDGGLTWKPVASSLATVGTYVWDTAQVPDGSAVLLRILAIHRAGEGADALAEPIVVGGNERLELLPLPFR